jgi:hypothetical protein
VSSNIANALLLWLVVYAGLLAIAGFTLFLVRGFSDRRWSNRAILRVSSGLAFVASAALWLAVVLAG